MMNLAFFLAVFWPIAALNIEECRPMGDCSLECASDRQTDFFCPDPEEIESGGSISNLYLQHNYLRVVSVPDILRCFPRVRFVNLMDNPLTELSCPSEDLQVQVLFDCGRGLPGYALDDLPPDVCSCTPDYHPGGSCPAILPPPTSGMDGGDSDVTTPTPDDESSAGGILGGVVFGVFLFSFAVLYILYKKLCRSVVTPPVPIAKNTDCAVQVDLTATNDDDSVYAEIVEYSNPPNEYANTLATRIHPFVCQV